MKRDTYFLIGAVALVLLAGGAWWWRHRPLAAPVPQTVAQVSESPPPAKADETPKYKIETPATPSAAMPQDVNAALTDLFGTKTVLSMFRPEDLTRRFVATVDNLGQPYAPTALWPVNPAGGRFTVERYENADAISARNGARYTPYVVLIEKINLPRAVELYSHLYPEFQKAYEDLGNPNQYFNDRLVAVIDQLLATPDFLTPLKVHLPPIDASLQPERPWVLYEFDDPALQSLSAGQRTLLRMGPANAKRLKAKLTEIRKLVTSGQVPR